MALTSLFPLAWGAWSPFARYPPHSTPPLSPCTAAFCDRSASPITREAAGADAQLQALRCLPPAVGRGLGARPSHRLPGFPGFGVPEATLLHLPLRLGSDPIPGVLLLGSVLSCEPQFYFGRGQDRVVFTGLIGGKSREESAPPFALLQDALRAMREGMAG